MGICRTDNIADNQIDNKAIDKIEQSCREYDIKIPFVNEISFEETVGFFGATGLLLVPSHSAEIETAGLFGASGLFLNPDVYVKAETAGLFGGYGVILKTGTF